GTGCSAISLHHRWSASAYVHSPPLPTLPHDPVPRFAQPALAHRPATPRLSPVLPCPIEEIPGVPPVVRVTLDDRAKTIRIVDNGRGMDWAGLSTFFQMHGENQDRKSGRPG